VDRFGKRGWTRQNSQALRAAIGVFNLWKAVQHYPQNRARMQHQNLSLRIIIAFEAEAVVTCMALSTSGGTGAAKNFCAAGE
jgi:hypothetical protein